MADDPDLLILEANHMALVKAVDPEVFLDYMRQNRVLSEEDVQTVESHYINPTRRARMRCFLNIIRTKGPENIQTFFQLLGWEYPHVYSDIFRQKPSAPPPTYTQGKTSRLSCGLNQLLTIGLDLNRVHDQKKDLAQQVKDMEAMLKLQKNEIEDLEREHQRLRQFERDNQQNQERLRTLTSNNDEIKEENRQFLHEIRTLTLELQKSRDRENQLQGQLDNTTQQIQEKSLELNRKNKEESVLRAKFENIRQASLRFESRPNESRAPNMAAIVNQTKQHQIEILMEDLRKTEGQLRFMEDLLEQEKNERDQMHRQVCALEHNKNTMESRQNTSVQKIERFYNIIKELEDQKRKLEEERMVMQTKFWEMSRAAEKQFEQLHRLETRYDQLQDSFTEFRQDHRYCVPGEMVDRQRERIPAVSCLPVASSRAQPRARSPALQTDHFKTSGCLDSSSSISGESSLTEASDGMASARRDPAFTPTAFTPPTALTPTAFTPTAFTPPTALIPPTALTPPVLAAVDEASVRGLAVGQRTGSMCVNVSKSMRKAKGEVPAKREEPVSDDDDSASTVSDLSSVSSSTFDLFDPTAPYSNHTDVNFVESPSQSPEASEAGNFFIRLNAREDGEGGEGCLRAEEGDILYVVAKGTELWKVMAVHKDTGKLHLDREGHIPNPDKNGDTFQRQTSNTSDGTNKSTLARANAFKRGNEMRRQQSTVCTFSVVCPMKATRKLPVLLLCASSMVKSVLSCLETTAADWANVIPDGAVTSATHLFAETEKHNILSWDIRPKDPLRYDSNLHKFIIIVLALQSQYALPTFRLLVGEPGLTMDYQQESRQLQDRLDMVHRAGLHCETVRVVAGQANRESFWAEVRDKVALVQRRVFWLETTHVPH